MGVARGRDDVETTAHQLVVDTVSGDVVGYSGSFLFTKLFMIDDWKKSWHDDGGIEGRELGSGFFFILYSFEADFFSCQADP